MGIVVTSMILVTFVAQDLLLFMPYVALGYGWGVTQAIEELSLPLQRD